jgi:hypothetical protein
LESDHIHQRQTITAKVQKMEAQNKSVKLNTKIFGAQLKKLHVYCMIFVKRMKIITKEIFCSYF